MLFEKKHIFSLQSYHARTDFLSRFRALWRLPLGYDLSVQGCTFKKICDSSKAKSVTIVKESRAKGTKRLQGTWLSTNLSTYWCLQKSDKAQVQTSQQSLTNDGNGWIFFVFCLPFSIIAVTCCGDRKTMRRSLASQRPIHLTISKHLAAIETPKTKFARLLGLLFLRSTIDGLQIDKNPSISNQFILWVCPTRLQAKSCLSWQI